MSIWIQPVPGRDHSVPVSYCRAAWAGVQIGPVRFLYSSGRSLRGRSSPRLHLLSPCCHLGLFTRQTDLLCRCGLAYGTTQAFRPSLYLRPAPWPPTTVAQLRSWLDFLHPDQPLAADLWTADLTAYPWLDLALPPASMPVTVAAEQAKLIWDRAPIAS